MAFSKLPHIVHRQTFEIHVQGSENVREITDQLVQAYYMAMPRVEAVLNAYDDPETIIRIDKVYIDLGHLELKNFEEVFSTRLQDALSSIVASTKILSGNSDSVVEGNSLKGIDKEASNSAGWHNSLSKTNEPSVVDTCTVAEGLGRSLLYFLANGLFPWWLSDRHDVSIHVTFSGALDGASPAFIGDLKRLIANDRNALQRLVCQFPVSFLERLISLIRKNSGNKVELLYRLAAALWDRRRVVSTSDDDMQSLHWLGTMEILAARDENVREVFINHIQHCINQRVFSVDDIREVLVPRQVPPLSFDQADVFLNGIGNAIERQQEKSSGDSFGDVFTDAVEVNRNDERHNSEQAADECIHVSHAGLVILHPFLPHFFDTLHLLTADRQFLNERARMRAVYLLGYLGGGKEDASEGELPFCKYLCGLPLKAALDKPVALNDETLEECQSLLCDVIKHWNSLKGTSSAGFREAFLSRKGKLDFKDGGHVLYVERMAYDILLETLPWGISYIHLPWLKQPITTIWN